MNTMQKKNVGIVAILMLLMALTRYHHFGISTALPDASYAVFFLGGLYLARVRGAFWILLLLMLEAALVDFYVITYRGVSGWCVTPAYGFLVFAYAALWQVGRWFAPKHKLTSAGVIGLFAAAAMAGSLAFVIANASFYLLAGYFNGMGIVEYASGVARYYGSYVGVTLFYTGCAVAIHMLHALVSGERHRVAV